MEENREQNMNKNEKESDFQESQIREEENVHYPKMIPSYDLNKIFHIDLSYNFDLLKDLLSSILRNQQLKDDKILDLESQLIDFKELLNEALKDPESAKKIQESKSKIAPLLAKPKKTSDYSCLSYLIHPPQNDIILETSKDNDPIVNKIIVSYK